MSHSTSISGVTAFDLREEDCLEGMTRIPDGTIDLVVTSPPYNLGIAYGSYVDRQDRQGYLDWCQQWTARFGEFSNRLVRSFSTWEPRLRIHFYLTKWSCG